MNLEHLRQDFPMLKQQMQDHPLVYLDNGATTFKPQSVIDTIVDYYTTFTANAHRGDYDLSAKVDEAYDLARQTVATFINAKKREVVFTTGTTDSLNLVAKGYVKQHLKAGDEILTSLAEHASNTLPWFDLVHEMGVVVNYIPLDEEGKITIEAVKNAISEKTKVISLAQVTNVMGYLLPAKEIGELCQKNNILFIIDGAQSVPHMKVDVKELGCDFLAFSGHKMLGPTGIGVLYGKYEILEDMTPTRTGGGNNARYDSCAIVDLKHAPDKLEAGTPNIAGVLGLKAAIDYLNQVGMDNIFNHEQELRAYAIEKLKEIEEVTVYNPTAVGPIAFNIKGVFSQDAASLFNTNGIAVRAGQHCAKILEDYLGVSNTVRASFYLYNTKEDVDALVEVCKKGDDFLDAFF